jgi:class 3 adenylate cyclase
VSDESSTELPEIVTEAILVVDLIESTATNNLFGWYAVGRSLLRDLRGLITTIGGPHGMRCVKSTGDGYLVTFYESHSAEMAAVHAVEACFELLTAVEVRNRQVSDERALHIRLALHIGEVDVVENDREGPHVSFTFRIESLSTGSLASAVNPITPDEFPLRNYLLCSEEVAGILLRRQVAVTAKLLGLFKLKGFSGWREIFQLTKEHAPIVDSQTA